MDPGRPPQFPDGKTRVWIIDTESRALPPRKAALRVRAAMRALKSWKAGRFYKKIDSTLRGNLVPELAEFLQGLPGRNDRLLAFVPAFPGAGRTVRNGALHVGGKLLSKTVFARDPRYPVRSSSIAKLAGPLSPRLWIPDVRTQADLRRTAKSLAKDDRMVSVAAVGAAGLAEELAKLWRLPTVDFGLRSNKQNERYSGLRHFNPQSAIRNPKSHEPVLVVVGSFHERSRRQLAYLEKSLGRFRKSGAVLIVRSPARRCSPSLALARIVRQVDFLMQQFRIRRFVLTGGETAAALCLRWNVRRWKIESSLGTGTPLCRPVGDRRAADWRMVMKPGGFGKDDILVKAVRYVA